MSQNSNLRKDYQYKDIPTILLESRIINLVGEVNEYMSYQIVSSLLVLEEQSDKPIQMFINSPGGSIHDGLAIIDTMNFIKAPVYTYAMGYAASMGAAILSAGDKGHRYALPNASVMIHQASSGTSGNIQDQRVSLQYTESLNEKLADIIAKNCGKTKEEYIADTHRDKWMFAEDALAYGIIDEIVTNTEESNK